MASASSGAAHCFRGFLIVCTNSYFLCTNNRTVCCLSVLCLFLSYSSLIPYNTMRFSTCTLLGLFSLFSGADASLRRRMSVDTECTIQVAEYLPEPGKKEGRKAFHCEPKARLFSHGRACVRVLLAVELLPPQRQSILTLVDHDADFRHTL